MNTELTARTLPVDRAFVVQFAADVAPAGRAEHVSSGTIVHFHSWAELQAFFESVIALRSGASE